MDIVMDKKSKKLTALFVSRVTEPGLYNDGNGLYLRIAPGGSKAWQYRYRIGNRQRDMGLGGTDTVSLADARKSLIEWKAIWRNGEDPIEVRKARKRATATRETLTFGEAAKRYIDAHSSGWKNAKHTAQWSSSLDMYAKPINNLPVEHIDTDLVMRCIKPIWNSKNETATRVRARIESVLGYAAVMGYRSGPNPALWRGHLSNLLPKPTKVRAVKHHTALPYQEVPEFIKRLRAMEGIAPMALEFAILTAARTGEIIGATWDEIDGDQWAIPAERMKAGKTHRVPLSKRAVEILELMASIRNSDFIFQGQRQGRPLSNMAMATVIKRMGSDCTVHGFRSSFRDWTAEKTNTPNIVCEMALAHTIANAAEAAYRRGDLLEKRKTLMDSWANYCESTPGQVIQLGGTNRQKVS